MAGGARRMRLSISEYSRELPEGVILRWSATTDSFELRKGGTLLAERKEKEVLRWKNPERVFAHIARRAMGLRHA